MGLLISILALLMGAVFAFILWLNELDNRKAMASKAKVVYDYESRTLGDPGAAGRRY